MAFRAVKGMNDILPNASGRWQRLEATFRRHADLHGFEEVRVPILEHTELFVRSIGEVTDIVEKEMYSFVHRDEALTLRPEGTAGVARALVEHKLYATAPVTRWYYLGPMFRAERPQRGRLRQFHQAGCEIFGDPGPACDAELISMIVDLLTDLGVAELEVAINSLGGPGTRARYRQALLGYLAPRAGELSDTARARLEANPLRILDSKHPRDVEVCAAAPSILDVLDAEDRAHFDGLRAALDALGTPYAVEPRLVRGLDYYTHTSFEIRSRAGELGSQNTLAGGGRYDAMVAELGGPGTPAIGFAMGLERILLALPEPAPSPRRGCFLAPMGQAATSRALGLARELRAAGVRAELDARGGSLRSLLRRADGSGARVCIVLGDAELGRGVAQVKDLELHAQEDVPLPEVVAHAAALTGSAAEAAS
ncbi:MAG: histidine--tRNA ligase [Polyangiaceae bacterium]|nr:histidine--tRNA ligase [Polyangiaceae bacterium]